MQARESATVELAVLQVDCLQSQSPAAVVCIVQAAAVVVLGECAACASD